MMREHSYMRVSLRGSELVKCESDRSGRNLCVVVGRERGASAGKRLRILVAGSFGCRPPVLRLQSASLCVNFLAEELLGFGDFAVPLAELLRC